MKRSFFILSAMLTLVIGAALLQSCSSESVYEEPLYGCYTEEEIEVIETMAEAYGLSIEVDRNYYGPKKTFAEFEEEMEYYADLSGEYEFKLLHNSDSNVYVASKVKREFSRIKTRSIEGEDSWSDSFFKGIYTFTLVIEWIESTNTKMPGYASGYIKASDNFNGDLFGTLHCTLGTKGSEYVLFSGTMPLIGYTYIISDGKLNIRTKKGSYLFQPFYVLN